MSESEKSSHTLGQCTPYDGFSDAKGVRKLPIRPDDYDDSHNYDRKRPMDRRPGLDEDPLITM